MGEQSSEQTTVEQRLRRELTIGDVLEQYPDAAPLLTEKGIHCVGCHVSPFETLEEGFRSHGMSEEEIDTTLADVNEKLDHVMKNKPARAPTVCSADPSLEVSCGAVAKVLELLKKEGKDTTKTALRIAVLPGGCSGMTYDFSFDSDGKQADDNVIEKDGLTVLVDKKSCRSFISFFSNCRSLGCICLRSCWNNCRTYFRYLKNSWVSRWLMSFCYQ